MVKTSLQDEINSLFSDSLDTYLTKRKAARIRFPPFVVVGGESSSAGSLRKVGSPFPPWAVFPGGSLGLKIFSPLKL